MKTIRISNDVWEAMAKHGKFGETPDDVLRRILKIEGSGLQASERRRKDGKMAFIDAHLAAKGESRKTKLEIAELFRRQFPTVKEQTAKNSVSWCASTLKRRTGIESNHLT